jgi:uncharacterized protein with NRDE domain
MCLLVLAWQAHPRYRLVVAANRDEYHARPAQALHRWPDPDILGGRDVRASGAWLALDAARRFGVVTNFRELQSTRAGAPSRGELIPRYLGGRAGAAEYFAQLAVRADAYSGFNLLLADADSLWYGSNRAPGFARALPPGVYGLSNQLLDTPWPKLLRVRRGFEAWLGEAAGEAAGLFAILNDHTQAADEAAPTLQSGLPPEWERVLSAPFVLNPEYGTRCSSVVLLEPSGRLYFAERRFTAGGDPAGQTEYQLNTNEWPAR